MSRAVEVGAVSGVILTLGMFGACSEDQGSRFRAGAGGDNGAGGGTGSTVTISVGTPSSTTGIMTTGSGSGGSGGSSSGDGGGVVVDPTPDPCMQTSDCAEGGAAYVCTVSNQCGKIQGMCSTNAECMGDSYCCSGVGADGGAPCRKDGAAQGVCIPGYVKPGVTRECRGAAKVGVFSPAVQCEWPNRVIVGGQPMAMPNLPPSPFQDHIQVMSWPMVADTPVDSGSAAEIVFVAGNQKTGEAGGNNPMYFGVVQIVSGLTCELKATLGEVPLRMTASPALADLDGDGTIDIVARKNVGGLVAYRWMGGRYVKYWEGATVPGLDRPYSPGNPGWDQIWDGPSIHDVNDDGMPDVLLRQAVYNGQTGALISAGPASPPVSQVWDGLIPVVGDLNNDGKLDQPMPSSSSWIALPGWNANAWAMFLPPGTVGANQFGSFATHFAYADFGSFQGTTFVHTVAALDKKAELVAVNADPNGVKNSVSVYSLDAMGLWQSVMQVQTVWDNAIPPPDPTVREELGGPPTIGDFDNDGLPEIAVAGGTRFRVFDLECRNGGAGCEAPFIKWSKLSQDGTSKQTGSSAFDFEGDGAVEVVYADECFLRVYDGKTGDVKFSAYRTSATWYEGPTIADVNKDFTTKIVVNSAEIDVRCPTGSTKGMPQIDPIHPGVRCLVNEDCPTMNCVSGFCRCTDPAMCGDPGLTCTTPLAGTPGTGNVCRAQHPNGGGANPLQRGVRVLGDKLNRWASSRPMWNQHAYSITNINDDGKVPKTSDWIANQNFKVAGLNNYRQNRQGTSGGAETLPDITGRIDKDACQLNGSQATLTVNICNRGERPVPSAVPVTFYDSMGGVLCTGLTDGPVPTGTGCKPVRCTIGAADIGRIVGKEVSIKANDDGKGQRGTVECNYDNNGDKISIMVCPGPA